MSNNKNEINIENYISDTKDLLEALYITPQEIITEGTLEDLLKLPVNEHYKNNQERIKRQNAFKIISTEIKSKE
jgi:hypothetical protein